MIDNSYIKIYKDQSEKAGVYQIISFLHNWFAYAYSNLLIIAHLLWETPWKTTKSIRFNKVSKDNLEMTPTLRRESQICFFWGEFVFVRKGSWRLCWEALMCDRCATGRPSPFALLPPPRCPPILTPQGEGFQRRKNQKLRTGKKVLFRVWCVGIKWEA